MNTDRKRGTLLGLAVGDALGASVEFKRPGTFPEVDGFRGGGPHGLPAGAWTDDTSMALALADSIATGGWNLDYQACCYLAWWRRGKYSVNDRCFDIGMTVQASLSDFQRTGDARTCASRSEHASGNGSIMRLAPVAIRCARMFPRRIEKLVQFCRESSLPTHASPQCLSACAYLGLLLGGLIQGAARDEVLAPQWEPLRRLQKAYPLHPTIREVAEGSFRCKHPPAIVGSGYVVQSLEAALWAFASATSFREAVLHAVNLGDDADTTGAVCGQLAGAYWGESGIPVEWRQGLVRRHMIENALDGLLRRRR